MVNITVVALVGRWCNGCTDGTLQLSGWTDGTLQLSGSYSLGRSTDRWEILDESLGTYIGLTSRNLYGTDTGDQHTLVAMLLRIYVGRVREITYDVIWKRFRCQPTGS